MLGDGGWRGWGGGIGVWGEERGEEKENDKGVGGLVRELELRNGRMNSDEG